MKHLKSFEKLTPYRMPYSVVGQAWNDLWKSHKFDYPIVNPIIIMRSKYDSDEDMIYIEISKFNDEYRSYEKIGDKYLRGTKEERMVFIKWIESLNLIQN